MNLMRLPLMLICILQIQFGTSQDAYLEVLGIAQDAGYPQMGCQRDCCKKITKKEKVASVAIILPRDSIYYLLDATPDIVAQTTAMTESGWHLAGIFLTHAHIGHYTGLMYLGRESLGAKNVPVYCMPRMFEFLSNNGPWSQLVELENISLHMMKKNAAICLKNRIYITPVPVPHRDEFSETVAYHIWGAHHSGWYIPDIDKWSKWDVDLTTRRDDFYLVDGTFYQNGEIWGRDMSEIPHPFIVETMDWFGPVHGSKVFFTHFNHTNPAMWDEATQKEIKSKGFNIAYEGLIIEL